MRCCPGPGRRVRSTPGAPTRHVVRKGSAYGLRLEADVWLDASIFERLLDDATSPKAPPDKVPGMLEQALDVSGGPFLAELPEHGAWCDRERERLDTRYGAAAAALLRHLEGEGRHERAALWAQRLIARDPCAEEAYRVLMRAQFRGGDRAGALRSYERCVAALEKASVRQDIAPFTDFLARLVAP